MSKRKVSLVFVPLLFPIVAAVAQYQFILAAPEVEVGQKTGQGPFPTLPPLSVTLTPLIYSADTGRAAVLQTWKPLSLLEALDVLAFPQAMVGTAITLAIVAAVAFQFFRRWRFPDLAALRACNLPKLIAGVVIAVLGFFIGLLGVLLVAAGAAEGPLGAHTAAIGMFMIIVGAIFVYLGAKIVIGSGCLAPKGS